MGVVHNCIRIRALHNYCSSKLLCCTFTSTWKCRLYDPSQRNNNIYRQPAHISTYNVFCCSSEMGHRAYISKIFSFTSFYPALVTTEAVRQRTLARGEGRPCSLLSQLWPAVPSTAGVWRSEQRVQATRRCLDSWCRERELEKGENIYSLPIHVYYVMRRVAPFTKHPLQYNIRWMQCIFGKQGKPT